MSVVTFKDQNVNNFRQFVSNLSLPTKNHYVNIIKENYLSFSAETNFFEVKKGDPVLDSLLDTKALNTYDVIPIFLRATALATGPKVFNLSSNYASAFENIDINIPCDNYEQPFPLVIIEFEDDFSTKNLVSNNFDEPPCKPELLNLLKDINFDTDRLLLEHPKVAIHSPSFIMIHHIKEAKALLLVLKMNSGVDLTSNMKLRDDKTIEECFSITLNNSNEKENESLNHEEKMLLKKFFRIACNLCMLACDFGYDKLHDSHMDKLQKLVQKKNKHHEKNLFEMNTRPVIYQLNQNIKLYESKNVAYDSDKTGRKMKSHWRRGHFRMQPYGETRSLRKRIFIKPLFINAVDFKGNVEDGMTNYTL